MLVPIDRAHGGLADDELASIGASPADVLDLSVNVNPYGPSPNVTSAIRGAVVDRYPDPSASGARRALAEVSRCSPSNVVVGNGAVDLLWTIARVFLSRSEAALIVEPTFSEFRAAAIATNARVIEWRARAESSFAVRLPEIAERALRERAAVVYLCSPGNPTGVCASSADIAQFARRVRDSIVVLDQSFLTLSERHFEIDDPLPDNVICVRSLTKAHSIPGLRVGYLLAREDIAAQIESGRPPWTVSAPAQAAAVAATREADFVAESRARLLADRARIGHRLASLELTIRPSSTFYSLLRVGDAAAVRHRLFTRHRVLVRDCSSFGLPDYIRISACAAHEDDRLISAFRAEVSPC